MVDLIPVRKEYKYEELTREDGPNGRRYVYGNQRLPSVTSILSFTGNKEALLRWKKEVGEEEAERIKNEASSIGTYMHSVIERMVAARDLPRPTNWWMVKGYEMGYRLVNTFFKNIDVIYGSEVPLYYPEKYAGTSDMVAMYRGQLAIIDFKQSNKPKKRNWIEDYFQQLAAYALAHDIVHGTRIEMGVILMACRDEQQTMLEFTTTGREWTQHGENWLRRVSQFYDAMPAALPRASDPGQGLEPEQEPRLGEE